MDDDINLPEIPEDQDAETDPTARGIVQCLRMLAEEAAALGMARTLDALHAAINACAAESDAAEQLEGNEGARPRATGSTRVH